MNTMNNSPINRILRGEPIHPADAYLARHIMTQLASKDQLPPSVAERLDDPKWPIQNLIDLLHEEVQADPTLYHPAQDHLLEKYPHSMY